MKATRNADGTVSTLVPVPPEEAFRLLEDPVAFRHLVAGARRIRRFDTRWPEPGTEVHHTVGIPPLLIRDRTVVVEHEPPRRLVLDAHLWPLGRFNVAFLLEPHPGGGTTLSVRERPEEGPVSWPGIRRATGQALVLRNLEICRRFRRMAPARSRAGGRSPRA